MRKKEQREEGRRKGKNSLKNKNICKFTKLIEI